MADTTAEEITIAKIMVNGHPVKEGDSAAVLFERTRKIPDTEGYFVVDEEGAPVGIVTRAHLEHVFGGMYGYNLHQHSKIADIMDANLLALDAETGISAAAQEAMARPGKYVYDAIAVTRKGRLVGKVTIRDLLLAFIKVSVENASDENPLTRLPGNRAIQKKIKKCIEKEKKWTIAYIDLDNFKAFNDAYSFTAGDQVILAAAKSLKEVFTENAFLGHVGGDDFVVVLDREKTEADCIKLCQVFHRLVLPLYSEEDRQRGYIISTDRNGEVRQFPIISLSIAIMSSQNLHGSDLKEKEFARILAETKKRAKHTEGDAVLVARHRGDECI